MSSTWPMVPLGEVLIKSDDWIQLHPDQKYKEVTVRLWGNGATLRREVFGAEIASASRLQVHVNQFIVSRIDARNGASGLVPDNLEGAVVSNDFPVFTPKAERLEPRFLGWLSKTNAFVDLCKAASEGTTNRVRLKEDRFLAMTIPLPSLTEQRQLVERIDAVAAKIREAQGLRRSIQEAGPILSSACARHCLNHRAAATVKPIRDLVDIRGGGTPSKANPYFWNGNIPWVSPKDMKVREIYDAIDHITEDAIKNSSAQLLPRRSVLVVVRGMILAHTVPAAVLQVPAAINQDMKAMIVSEEILPEYLCEMIWANNRQLLSLVEKSTHDTRKLETPRLLDFAIPVPPLQEQRRLLSGLSEMQERAASAVALQHGTQLELDAMLPAILDRAFRGEL